MLGFSPIASSPLSDSGTKVYQQIVLAAITTVASMVPYRQLIKTLTAFSSSVVSMITRVIVSAVDRTMSIGAENRTMILSSEDRTMRIEVEDRTMQLEAEDRTMTR